MRGRYFYIPEDVASAPASGECIVDAWWTIHPDKGLAFYFVPKGYYKSDEPSPQCNQSEHTARALQERLQPECITKHVPVVFMRHAQREMTRLREVS